MKRIAFLTMVALMAISCNNSSKKTETTETTETTVEQEAIGGAKDEHGCLSSAGETWSELKQTCLQIFNVGIRLNPIEVKENEAVISAFVLFSEDNNKAELFLPSGNQPNIILEKTQENIYVKDTYTYNSKTGALSIEGKEVYKKEDK